MWPIIAGAVGGAALQGGMSAIAGDAADASADYQREIDRSLDAVLRASFQSDPLMDLILGSLSKVEGAPFDPEKVYEQGLEQLDWIRKRREFDAQRMMATQGFGEGSAQEEYGQRALDVQQGAERGDLRSLIDEAAIMARPGEMAQNWDLFSSLLGQNLAVGAAGGMLGTPAARGPAYQSGGQGLPNVDDALAQSYLPQNLQSSFFST